MPTNRPTVAPRGTCPECGRDVALLGDGTVARHHYNLAGRRCLGYGEQVRSWTDREAFPSPADLSAERFGLTDDVPHLRAQTQGEQGEQ